MLGFLTGEAARDLRRAGRVAVAAVLLITLSLGALGAFWLASVNLGRAVAQWRERVRVVAYLKQEPGTKLDALLMRVQGIGGVKAVRYVSKAEALGSLRRSLGDQAGVLDQVPGNPLPASLEITLDESAATPDGARAVVQRLGTFPEVEEVQGGAEWADALAHWRRLLEVLGLGVGAVLALAAILAVTTATTLVLHARRDETEIMRLVGASETVIRLPLLLQGVAQGVAGAGLAVGVLAILHLALSPRIEPLLALTLGLTRAVFLSPPQIVALVVGGAVLGALGGLLARSRA